MGENQANMVSKHMFEGQGAVKSSAAKNRLCHNQIPIFKHTTLGRYSQWATTL